MIKKIPVFFFFIYSFLLGAQKTITGIVMDTKNIPIEGAAVYLNNTTIGTTTDEDGKFSLKTPSGNYELIISFLGFKTISYPLKNTENPEPMRFRMRAKNLLLDEIVIPKKIKRSKRRKYLRMFRQNFLGESTFARKCRIFNEKALKFNFNEDTNTLTAFASEPLSIVNNKLGYKITYDLLEFEIIDQKVTYSGTARFEEMSGIRDQQIEWSRNRKEIYLGSSTHFLRSTLLDKIFEEKYIIDQIQLIKNPLYPSTKEINKAKKILRDTRKQSKSYTKKELEEATKILNRTKLQKFKSEVIKTKLEPYEYSQYDGTKNYLEFQDYLKITYYGNYPDENYNKLKKQKFKYQVSLIKLKDNVAVLESTGELANPLDIFMEGYWAFKRIGDLLPLNYNPN